MSTAFRPLGAPAVGWDVTDTLGYYIHRGYVYLNGVIFTTGDGTATQLLMTLPPEARPDSSIPLTLYATDAGTQFTQDVALQLPTEYAATIHTDGRLTLDAPLPPQVLVAPSIADYWFIDINSTHFARYTRPLDLSLLLGNTRWRIGTPVIDEIPPTTSLSGFMAGGDFTNIDAGYVVHDERVHLVGTVRANTDGATNLLTSMPADAAAGLVDTDNYDTLVHSSGQNLALYVDTAEAFLSEDIMKAAGEPPTLSQATPPWSVYRPLSNVEYGPVNLGNNLIRGQVIGAGPSIGPGVYDAGGTVDYGDYVCAGFTCHQGGGVPSLTLDLDYLINSLDPIPEWFILRLFPVAHADVEAQGCTGGGCGPSIPVDNTIVVTTGTPAVYLNFDGTTAPWVGGNPKWLAPATPLYTGTTGLFAPTGDYPPTGPEFLWQRGQLSGTITVDFPSAIVSRGGSEAQLVIYAGYEMREHGLHAGDILDLADAGWVGVDPEFGIIPGNIGGGPLSRGIVRMR